MKHSAQSQSIFLQLLFITALSAPPDWFTINQSVLFSPLCSPELLLGRVIFLLHVISAAVSLRTLWFPIAQPVDIYSTNTWHLEIVFLCEEPAAPSAQRRPAGRPLYRAAGRYGPDPLSNWCFLQKIWSFQSKHESECLIDFLLSTSGLLGFLQWS